MNGRLPTAVANRPDVRQDVMNAVNQSGRGGTNRRTDGGTHAETDWIASDAADAAFDQALELDRSAQQHAAALPAGR